MLVMTETLRAKYLDSKDMTLQATEDYTKIVQTIKPVTLLVWEQEIQLAEKNRQQNIKAMDIYSAQIPSMSGPSALTMAPGPDLESTPGEQLMEFALVVEETQWVYIHFMTKITPMHYSFRIQLQDIVRRSSTPNEQEVIDEK